MAGLAHRAPAQVPARSHSTRFRSQGRSTARALLFDGNRERMMDTKSQLRELNESEVATVTGGAVTLDFGIVRIYMSFPGIEAGPTSGAILCGDNGCITR